MDPSLETTYYLGEFCKSKLSYQPLDRLNVKLLIYFLHKTNAVLRARQSSRVSPREIELSWRCGRRHLELLGDMPAWFSPQKKCLMRYHRAHVAKVSALSFPRVAHFCAAPYHQEQQENAGYNDQDEILCFESAEECHKRSDNRHRDPDHERESFFWRRQQQSGEDALGSSSCNTPWKLSFCPYCTYPSIEPR